MSCCFGKTTDGNDPKKSVSDHSDIPSDRPIIPVSKPVNPKIEYSVTVKTGDFRNSGTNGPVYIRIFGRDDKQTEDLLLSGSDKSFAQSCTRKFQPIGTDIGKPQRIILRHEDKSTGWYVDYVEISVHNFLVRFVANRWLNRLKNDQKLEVELFASEQPAVMYNIEVQTGEEQSEPLDSPVYLQIYGTTTTTPKLYLESKTAAFTKDSLSKFSISSNNVGEIQRIVIGHEGLGKVNDWYLKHVKLQMLAQQHEYTVNKLLSLTQGEQRLFVELSQEKPRSPPPVSPAYLISLKTADIISPLQSIENVEMLVRGSDSQIVKTALKAHAKNKDQLLFQQGNVDDFELEHPDIGQIESITIGFSDSEQKSAWLLEAVDIKYRETTYHFRAQCWLSSRLGPDFSWMTIKPDPNEDDISYQIVVQTGQSGITSNVILCVFGEEETTSNLALRTTKDGSQARFDKDSVQAFDLKAIDVGKIRKINIGHDGKGDEQEWFLKSIQIEKKDEKYTFSVDRWLSEEKDDKKTFINLLPDAQKVTPAATPVLKKDQSVYSITIVTSSDDHAGTDSGVLMTITGDKDITKQFPLNKTKQGDQASFETGQTNEFEVELDDVGQITKVNIGQDGSGSHAKWILESVQIKKGLENYYFLAKKTLDQSTPFIDLTPSPARRTPTPEPAKAKSPTPEPVKQKSPTPEPVKAKSSTPEPAKTDTARSVASEPKAMPVKEISYKVLIQTGSMQKDPIKDDNHFYLTIFGQNDQTKQLFFRDLEKKKSFKRDEKTEVEFKAVDVGKISKIVIGQEQSENDVRWHVDNVTIKRHNETTTFNAEKTVGSNSQIELTPSAIPKKTETTYKIHLRTGAQQEEGDASNLQITIFGENGQTKKVSLNETTRTNKKPSIKKEEKIDFESKGHDVGKVTKILLSQDSNEKGVHWHIDYITIKRHNETTTFQLDRQLDQNNEEEFTPSPLVPKKSETPRKPAKSSETISQAVIKSKDADYEISTWTGDQTFEVPVTLRIQGEYGIVSIPLTSTKSGEKPFQSKATDEFTCHTNNVGKIKRVTVEHQGADQDVLWHLKKLQIKKGTETYYFNADVHLDQKEKKVNLYPVGALFGHQREDYVQSELRRLREGLRSESSKLRAPTHKAYEPFVFNDLGPYFDTSPVERAIYSPLDAPLGYHTRITALRIVEPWEAYGMDYGVSYELFKQRRSRSLNPKRSVDRSDDDSIDRKQGSTHLPKFPCVSMQKPAEYSRSLTMNDVPKIRSLIRTRYTAQAGSQMEKDYKRTQDDLYRMQLDQLNGYHQSNRDNMVRVYHSYLENTPGSKKALRELCDRIAINPKPSSESTA